MYVGCLGSSLVVLELNVQGCNLPVFCILCYVSNGTMNWVMHGPGTECAVHFQ